MSDSLGWAPRAATYRSSSNGQSLGSAGAGSKVKEHVAPKGHMRICGKCRRNKLADANPGPCHACQRKHGRKLSRTKNWCLTVPIGTPLPVPMS
jgi:hypothetical protein